MNDWAEPPDGGFPSDDVVRLLRLLARRGATLAAEPRDSSHLRVERGGDCLGMIETAVRDRAVRAGLVDVSASDGRGRLGDAGRAIIAAVRAAEAARAALSSTGAAGNDSMPVLPRQAGQPEQRPNGSAAPRPADRPGFDADESPLAWLARRRDKDGRPLIEQVEFDAGERFRADFCFAQMAPRVTANWSTEAACGRGGRAGGPAAVEMRDNVVAAQERVRRALAAVGPELAGILVDVCGHLKGLEQAERGARWPARSGKVILQLALSSLARHYGLKPAATERGAVRHWGAQGYRPSIGVVVDES